LSGKDIPAKEALVKSIRFFGIWRKILNAPMISHAAASTSFRKREPRKLKPVQLFWAMVLSFGTESERTQAGVTRLAGLFGGDPVSRQAVHDRLKQSAAVAFFSQVYQTLLGRTFQRIREPLPEAYQNFEDISLLDSTTIKVADRLGKLFPACRSNVRKAALKIHAQMSLSRKQAERLRITAERVHDAKGGLFGQWVKDRLVMFDLGYWYFNYTLFRQIKEDGGHFLTRLKESANGTIVKVRRGCLKRHVEGPLNRRIYRGPAVDLDAVFGHGPSTVTLRVVGIWDKELGNYHWYVTSLDPESFPPEEIAQVYRLRWQIELLFKEWKSLCRIDRLSSEKEEIVLCFIYASLCAALLSRIALWLASQRFGIPWIQMCTSNGLKILGCFARELGEAILRGRVRQLRAVLSKLLDALAIHAMLPNRTNALVELSSHAR
jgi:putative transposase